MNHLILMRHAEAEASGPGGDDHARGLTSRGRADAGRVAEALWRPPLRPHLALVSSSVRTRETWDVVSENFHDDIVEVQVRDDIYDADLATLTRAVGMAAEHPGCVILIGHNPGIHMLAVHLLHDNAAGPYALERLSRGFPAGAAAVFEAEAGGLRLADFISPDQA